MDLSIWRLPLESVTREAEKRMLSEELPKCLDEVSATDPDLVVFGCTSAGSLGGLAHDVAIGRRIAEATSAGAVTVVAATVEKLDERRPQQVALFTPYTGDLTKSVADSLTEAGYHVVVARGMGITDNEVIGRMDPAEIIEFVEPRMAGVNADCVFLSCTNWRAAETLDALSSSVGIPVFSSNQVSFAAAERRLVLGGNSS
jgi:maleate isomerase